MTRIPTHSRMQTVRCLVAVVRGLVRALDGNVEVLRLRLGERRELDVQLGKVGASDLLIKLFGQHVHAKLELIGVGPESDLREDLVGERA